MCLYFSKSCTIDVRYVRWRYVSVAIHLRSDGGRWTNSSNSKTETQVWPALLHASDFMFTGMLIQIDWTIHIHTPYGVSAGTLQSISILIQCTAKLKLVSLSFRSLSLDRSFCSAVALAVAEAAIALYVLWRFRYFHNSLMASVVPLPCNAPSTCRHHCNAWLYEFSYTIEANASCQHRKKNAEQTKINRYYKHSKFKIKRKNEQKK